MKRPPMPLMPRSPKGHACLVEGMLGALVQHRWRILETYKLTPGCCDNHLDHNEVDHQTSLKMTNIHWMFHKHKQQREQYSCLKQYMARPQLVKGMEDPPRKWQFPRVCVLLVRLEAHWGFWQCSSRRDLFFLASRQQIPSSLVQTFLNTKKHMFFSHVYTLYKTGIHHHGGETWHLSHRSSRFSSGDVSRCQANLWWRHIADQPMNDDHHSLWGVCLEMMGCCWNSVWRLVSKDL